MGKRRRPPAAGKGCMRGEESDEPSSDVEDVSADIAITHEDAKDKASDWRRAGQAARQVLNMLSEEKVRAAARGSSSSKGKGPGKGCKGEGKYKDTVNKGKGGKDEGKGKGEARDCISSSSSAPAPKAGAIADEELVADFFCDFSDDEPTQAEQARQALEELRADDWLNPNAKRPQWFIDNITP